LVNVYIIGTLMVHKWNPIIGHLIEKCASWSKFLLFVDDYKAEVMLCLKVIDLRSSSLGMNKNEARVW